MKTIEYFDPFHEFKRYADDDLVPMWAIELFNYLDKLTKLYEELLFEKRCPY